MNVRLLPEGDLERMVELGNLWKRHWVLVIVALAAIVGFGVFFASVLRAYSQSHCGFLTSVPAPLALRTEVA